MDVINLSAMKTICFILTVGLLVISACSREPHIYTRKLDDRIKSSFYNKPGSYWIYRDSVTGEMDSVVLLYSEFGLDNSKADITGEAYEYLSLAFHMVHLSAKADDTILLNYFFDADEGNYFASDALEGNAQTPVLQFRFSIPFLQGGAIQAYDTIVYSRLPYPYRIGLNEFKEVTQVIQSKKDGSGESGMVYWDDFTGPVKICLPVKKSIGSPVKVLELQRWNLNKR